MLFLSRARGVELTADPLFARRVRRLAATSAVALGAIWLLAVTAVAAPPGANLSLLAGWILMPSILWLSLRRPMVRQALVVPSALVTLGLVAICLAPLSPVARVGWSVLLGGILLGDLLGLWFWFRALPVPTALEEPFGRARWAFIAAHVGLVVAGVSIVGIASIS
jgi:hypothetical protein